MIIDSPLTSLLHVSQALQAQTPQAEQEKAWADGWQSERKREKSPRRLTRGERGGNGGRFGSLHARKTKFFDEAVDRAKVYIRRENEELRQQEAFAAERQEEQRLAALEEQRQSQRESQRQSQWSSWSSWQCHQGN